jgi:Right handed beta helix region
MKGRAQMTTSTRARRHHVAAAIVAVFSTSVTGLIAIAAPAQAAPAQRCSVAGGTGLTAARIASAHQRISGHIDATGCDVGVYVGPKADGVTITHATITGAGDHGIFVQDASRVAILDNSVVGNGLSLNSKGIVEDKAIELVGTTDSVVLRNVVQGNLADGGIALNDDGPAVDPGAPVADATALHPSKRNMVIGNEVSGNAVGCGIVLSSDNPGAGVLDNTVANNTLTDTPGVMTKNGPPISGIVLAGQLVENNRVLHNTVHGSFMPGIIVHSNTPAEVVSGTLIAFNTLTDDDWGKINGPDVATAVVVGAGATPGGTGVLSGTWLFANTISNESIGIDEYGATATRTFANRFRNVGTPISSS